MEATSLQPEQQPGVASAEGGNVMLDGPDGVAVSMTAACARETGRSLLAAADLADSQVKPEEG